MLENYTTIDKYLEPVKREVLLEPEEKYDLLGVKWYGKGVFIRETKLGKEIKATKLFKVIAGDFIYNRLFAWKNSFAIIPKEFDGCLVSGEFPTFIKKFNDVNNYFILQYILLPHNIDKVDKLSTGMSSVSRKRFKENSFLTFPIPDLDKDEQEKISEIISKHIHSNQNIFNEVEQQENLLKQLRQAILQEAVEGKLTVKWRKRNPDLISGENHAFDLLEKIKTERERLIKEGKVKKQKPLPTINEDEKPFDLPEGWVWCRLGDLRNFTFSLSYGVLVPGPNIENGIPFVRVQDLDHAIEGYKPSKSISSKIDSQYLRTRLIGNEILICVVGSIGKLAIAPKSWSGANIARAVCRFMPNPNLSTKYLYTCLGSPFVQYFFNKSYKSIQPTLNVSILEKTLIMIAPTAEQQAIVEKIEKLMAKIDAMEEHVKIRKVQTEQLMQAVLREAFNGD